MKQPNVARFERCTMSPVARAKMEEQLAKETWRAKCNNCGDIKGTLAELRNHRCGTSSQPDAAPSGR